MGITILKALMFVCGLAFLFVVYGAILMDDSISWAMLLVLGSLVYLFYYLSSDNF